MLVTDFLLPAASMIRVVSEELRSLVPSRVLPRVTVVPNAVDTRRFSKVAPRAGGPWLFAGRLADGKTGGLAKLLAWAPELGITQVHVAGEGPEAAGLTTTPEVSVTHLGWVDVSTVLGNGYAGVIGMGRVVLEGAAAGLPVIVSGYEHVLGLLEPANFDAFAWSNFSGRGVAPATVESLKAAFERHSSAALAALRERVREEHDDRGAADANVERYANSRVRHTSMLRLRQVYGLLRRGAPRGGPSWISDESVERGLELLVRGTPGASTPTLRLESALRRLEARIDAQAELSKERAETLAAAVQELRRLVDAAPEEGRRALEGTLRAELAAVGERLARLEAEVRHQPVDEVARALFRALPPELRKRLKPTPGGP